MSTINCPSRRNAITYPWNVSGGNAAGRQPIVNAGTPTAVARSDYAANNGYLYVHCGNPTPAAWQENVAGGSGPSDVTAVENPPGQMTTAARTTFANVALKATGVIFPGSMIRLSDITDGASKTYLLGEKYLQPDCYDTGADGGDNESAMMGSNPDIERYAYYQPMPDTPGQSSYCFGSAHANGFQMAFCDGSVKMMNYTIDLNVHRNLCERADGNVIDAKAF